MADFTPPADQSAAIKDNTAAIQESARRQEEMVRELQALRQSMGATAGGSVRGLSGPAIAAIGTMALGMNKAISAIHQAATAMQRASVATARTAAVSSGRLIAPGSPRWQQVDMAREAKKVAEGHLFSARQARDSGALRKILPPVYGEQAARMEESAINHRARRDYLDEAIGDERTRKTHPTDIRRAVIQELRRDTEKQMAASSGGELRALTMRQHMASPMFGEAAQRGFRAGAENDTTGLMKQVELSKEKVKWLGGSEAKRALKEQARLQKELTKGQLAEKYARIATEQGRIAEGAARWNDKIAPVAGYMQSIASAGGVAAVSMMGLVSATASSAGAFSVWPTFTESIKGLAIEVGAVFLPVVDEMSKKIQDATEWFRNLDEGTKSTMGTIARWTIVIGGGIFALQKLGIAWLASAAAAKVAAIGYAMALTPLGWVAVAATAVGVLAGAWLLAGKNARGAVTDMGRGVGNFLMPGGESKSQQKLTPLLAAMEGTYTHDKAISLLNKPAKLAEEMGEHGDFYAEKIGGRSAELGKILQEKAKFQKEAQRHHQEMMKHEKNKDWDKYSDTKSDYDLAARKYFDRQKVAGAFSKDIERMEKVRGAILGLGDYAKSGGLGAKEDRLRRAYQGLPQPRITDPASVADQIQIKALNPDELGVRNAMRQLELLAKSGGVFNGEAITKLQQAVDELKMLNNKMPMD